MTPRTLTKSATPAKRRGRPAKTQAQEKKLIDVLVDPTEKLAADDAKAAADQKDAAVYAAMRKIKADDEAAADKRARRSAAALAPVIRAAEAIAKLPRTLGGFAVTDNGVLVTFPSGLAIGLRYDNDGTSEMPLELVSHDETRAMTVEEAVEWLMRTAISFGIQLPQD